MKVKRLMSVFLVGVMLFPGGVIYGAESSVDIESLSGSNRYSTAIGVSRYGWQDRAKEVILVNSSAVADALSVAPLAKLKDAPVLLTDKNTLNSTTRSEIGRLNPERITIVGGQGSVAENIETDLSSQGYRVERIAGLNRNHTSEMIAVQIKNIYEQDGKKLEGAFIVEGFKGLADAAGAGAIAAKMGYPLLMVSSNKKFESSLVNDLNQVSVYIVGGVASDLKNYFASATVIAGSNRNKTNVELIRRFYPNGFDKTFIAKDGRSNPSELIDSVTIGGLAAREEAPVILVDASKNIYKETKNLVAGNLLKKVLKVSGGIDLQVDQMLGNTDEVLPIVDEKPPIVKPENPRGADTRDRTKFEYWNEANHYSTDLLMTQGQIEEWNRENLKNTSLLIDPISIDGKEYGIMTRREIARTKPAYPGNVSFDSTANTALNPWESLYVEKYTSNRRWAFVRTVNAHGWLPVDSFSIVTRETARKYESMPFAVITGRQYLNGQTRIDMGNKLPMNGDRVLLPVRKPDGSLSTREIGFDSGSMSRGYLPYTRANIIKQGLKFQNEVYGWGGSKNAHDCSSLIQDVFKSMGLILPRNSKEQEEVNFGIHARLTSPNKLSKLSVMQPGTALYMQGHTMLYIGKDKSGTLSMVHQYAGHYVGSKYVPVYAGKVTSVNIGGGSGRTYLDNVRTTVDWIR